MEIPKIVGAGLVIIGTGIGNGLNGRGAMDAIGSQPDATNKILKTPTSNQNISARKEQKHNNNHPFSNTHLTLQKNP